MPVCPPVFEGPPQAGAPLSIPEFPTCYPGTVADRQGRFEPGICDDDRLDRREKITLMEKFGKDWVLECLPRKKREARERRRLESQRELQDDRYGSASRLSRQQTNLDISESSRSHNYTRDIEGILRDGAVQFAEGK